MIQNIDQSSSDFNSDSITASAPTADLGTSVASTSSIVTAAVMHAVLLGAAAIASKHDADLHSAQTASTNDSSQKTPDNNADPSSKAGSGGSSINSLFQDQTDPMETDLAQLQSIEMALSEKEDLLQKLIALSYSMKNSFLICELMYNALGDAKGEQAAQYGAINNIDSAMGNTNANAQNELNNAVKYLEGIIDPPGSTTGPAVKYVLNDLNKVAGDMSSFHWQQLTADFNQFNADAQKYLPASLMSAIQPDINTMLADLPGIANNQDGNQPQGDTNDFMNAMFDIYNKLYIPTGSGSTDKLMTDLQNVVKDLQNGSDPTNDCATLVADAKASGNNNLYMTAQEIQGTSGYGQQEYIGGMFAQLVNPSGQQPPVPPTPPPVDPTKADQYIQGFIQQIDELQNFIKANQGLFTDGGGASILQQIQTMKDTFKNSNGVWGNADSMRAVLTQWIQEANGANGSGGTAPQQLQTLSGALQSIDRATDAQSTSSRMTADFDLNEVKQIIGGQESFVQAPLQAENGFVRNQKAQ
jgi:hypothetical protein